MHPIRPVLALALLALIAASLRAQVYTVSTFAGSPGQSGTTDGTGTAARFQQPGPLAIDSTGNLYVADSLAGTLRRISPTAVVTTVCTIPGGTAGLAVSPSGAVYLSDAFSHVIRRVEADGTLSTFAGLPGAAGFADGRGDAARFNQPGGLAFDSSGRLYVADTFNHTIRRVTAAGDVATLAGLPGVTGSVDGAGFVARFSSPMSLVVAADGNVTIADRGNYLLRRLVPDGTVSTFAGTTNYYGFSETGAGSAVRFDSLGFLALDVGGNLIVPETGRRTIRRVAPDAFVTAVAGLANVSGATDGLGSTARFSSLSGVAIDAAGRVFVADSGNRVIRLIEAVAAPLVSSGPTAQTVAVGSSSTFGVVATGGAPLAYRWQRKAAGQSFFENVADGGAYSGASTATLAIAGTTVAMHGDVFRCIVSNAAGAATTDAAALSVLSAPSLPSTRTTTLYVGTSATLSVGGGGHPAPVYSVTAGSLPSWLSLDPVTGVLSGTPPSPTGSPLSFSITAANARGSAVQAFSVTVNSALAPPFVTLFGSRRLIVGPGGTVSLSGSGGGTAPLSYQWKRNGRPIPGATSSTYTATSVARGDAGYYQLVVSNPAGSVVSPAVFVQLVYSSTELLHISGSTVPPSDLNVVAVAAGAYFGMALRADGGVSVWGESTVSSVPSVATDVVAIAAGDYHCLALRADGTVVAWGSDSYNQSKVPTGLGGVVAIAAGTYHSLALKGDGTVVEWGAVTPGTNSYAPVPSGFTDGIGLAAAGNVSHAVRADGSIVSWGRDSNGLSVPPAGALPAASVYTSGSVSFSLRTDGTVVGWGSTSYSLPTVPAGLSGVVELAVAFNSVMALKADGTVSVWGSADAPTSFLSAVSVVDVAYGSYYRLALRNSSADAAPVLVSSPTSVAANLGQGVTLRGGFSAGTASMSYQWYRAGSAIPGATSASYRIEGVTVADIGAYTVTATNSRGTASSAAAQITLNSSPLLGPGSGGRYALTSGQSLTLGLSSAVPAGAAIRWERNGRAVIGATGRTLAISSAQPADAGYYRAVFDSGSGPSATAVLFVSVAPLVTQTLRFGQQGQALSVSADFNRTVIALSQRGSVVLGLRADGTVTRTPGNDYYYYANSATTAVAALRQIVAVSLGGDCGYALRSDGTVASWNEQSSTPDPLRTATLSDIVAISAGSTHLLALRADGTVAVAGVSAYGATAVPAGLRDVVAVAAGDHFSLALRSDGTVVGWGRNTYGESTTPASLTGVLAISAGSSASYALKSDRTVAAWGYNSYGQLAVPSDLRDVLSVTAGDSGALAVRTDGSVVVWGTSGYSNVPLSLPASLAQVVAGDVSSSEAWVLRDASADTVPVISVQPVAVTALAGQNVRFSVSAAAGTASVGYQWRRAGAAIVGATESSLILPRVSVADAGLVEVVASSYLGSVTSQSVALSVDPTPAVSVSPGGRQVLAAGGSLTLSGTTSLAGPVRYQWRRNGRTIPGATQLTYTIAGAAHVHSGRYEFVATNTAGVAVSAPVWVGVDNALVVTSWGQNGAHRAGQPSALGPVLEIAAGGSHVLALRLDGTVAAWGGNESQQCTVPAGLRDVVALAAGDSFSLALRADGTVVAWGRLNYVPTGVADVVAISADAGSSHAVALRANGSVVHWNYESVRSDLPAAARDLVAVDTGYLGRTVALRSDGRVVQWAPTAYYDSATVAAMPEGIGHLVAAVVAESEFYGLRADGSTVRWPVSTAFSVVPSEVPELSGLTALVGSGLTVAGLLGDGTVVVRANLGYVGSSAIAAGASAVAPAHSLALGGTFAVALRDSAGDRAPTIVNLSPAQTLTVGQAFQLSVTASGVPAPSFQWYRNGVAISGATSATYSLVSGYYGDASGAYSVIVSNARGSVTSSEIVVTVLPASGSRGLLSGMARSTSAGSLYGSFVVEGTASKLMLVRGVGPALSTYGAQGLMSDPQVAIFNSSGTLFAQNDNWGLASNASAIATAARSAGAIPLAAGSRDAAVLHSFPPGSYHVRLTAASGADGLALLELYDADTTPRLVSLSVLGTADAGAGVLVQGLTLAPPATGRTYLVRALGPALGSARALANPVLTIRDSSDALVASNDDWAGAAPLVALAATVGAHPLVDVGSRDAALAFTPAAAGGTYTVQVAPAPGTPGGLVLLEVFESDPARSAALAPAVVAPPQPVLALAGSDASFGVVVTGRPAPTFQWRKNGTTIAGATRAQLALSAVSSGDAADYSVAVTNSSGTVVSPAAALTLTQLAATHSVVGHGYFAGASATVACSLSYAGTAASLGWEIVLPAGWSYAGGAGAEGDVKPAVGATGTLSWAWSTPPPSPLSFSLRFNVPAGETQPRALFATALLRTSAGSQSTAAVPGSLSLDPAPSLHAADTNSDGRLSLAELTRAIELYNVRAGTARTGAYSVATTTTEDGFALDSARGNLPAVLARYHTADTDRDGRLNLSELLRVIQLYNYRAASVRTGQYRVSPGTEDGFDPGP